MIPAELLSQPHLIQHAPRTSNGGVNRFSVDFFPIDFYDNCFLLRRQSVAESRIAIASGHHDGLEVASDAFPQYQSDIGLLPIYRLPIFSRTFQIASALLYVSSSTSLSNPSRSQFLALPTTPPTSSFPSTHLSSPAQVTLLILHPSHPLPMAPILTIPVSRPKRPSRDQNPERRCKRPHDEILNGIPTPHLL